MATSTDWSPRQRIEAECDRRGRGAVVAGCARLLEGDESDMSLMIALSRTNAEYVLSGEARTDQTYWLRVWAARGLLWALDTSTYDDDVRRAVHSGLHDEAWRVREMTAKVIARHRLGDALTEVAKLREDPIQRVRTAAHRAVTMIVESGA